MSAEAAVLNGDSWLAALRDLPQNPLAQMLLHARERRARRLPLLRRLWLLWAILAVPALFTILNQLTLESRPGEFVETLLALAVPAAWLAEWFYTAGLDGLNLLGGKGSGFRLDDALAMSRLTDREIVLAYLRVHLPGLLMRLGILLVVIWIWQISMVEGNSNTYLYFAANGQQSLSPSRDPYDSPLALSDEGSYYWRSALGEVLRLSTLEPAQLVMCIAGRTLPGLPLVALATLLSTLVLGLQALLAGCIYLLVQLCLGRGSAGALGQQFKCLPAIAGFAVYAWLSWISVNQNSYVAAREGPPALGIIGASILLVISAMILGLSLARDSAWLRPMFWPALIFLACLSHYALSSFAGPQTYIKNYAGQQAAQSSLWAWGALAPFNPLALPAPLAWMQLQYVGTAPPVESLWQYPILLVTQCLLILFLLGLAAENVSLRRQHLQ